MNSAASSPSKKPLAPLVAALAIEAVSIDSASSSQQGPLLLTHNHKRKSKRCSKRIYGNQRGSLFFFAHVKMFDVALQLLQKNLESELYRSYTERVRGVG